MEPESRRAVIIGYVNAKPIIVQASNKKFKLCTRRHSYQFDFLPLIRTSHMELPSFLFLKKEEKIISQLIKLSDNIFSQLLSDTINYGLLVTRKAKTCRHFWAIWFKFGRVIALIVLCSLIQIPSEYNVYVMCIIIVFFLSILCNPYS